MLCPECTEDTNPTLKFCQFCNAPLDLDFDRIGAALAYESEDLVKERLTRTMTGYLYMSIFILVITILFRVVLEAPVDVEQYPSYTVPPEIVSTSDQDQVIPIEVDKVELPK